MRVSRAKLFRATATPLASIFGSGFLVIVPILAGAAGKFSLFAMIAICALAYSVGWVIRFNIANAEPVLDARKALKSTLYLDRISDIALVPAYVISVCLYLRILSSFLMNGLGLMTQLNARFLTTGIILLICIVGFIKGLEVLQKLEGWAIWVTMAIIAIMIVGFGLHDISLSSGPGIELPVYPGHSILHMLAILGGTLICVQGFETSRYLGEEYSKEMRIKSCRLSQIIATAVYIVFIAVAIPLMHYLTGPVRDDSLIVLAGKASLLLPVPLIAAAVLSQFSAAVADTLGGEGNMAEATREKINHKIAYLIMAGGSIILAWSASTFQIVALASKAFALYYMLQCLVAVTVSKGIVKKSFMIFLALIMLAIALFAVPVG
jgi:hypothetical protein